MSAVFIYGLGYSCRPMYTERFSLPFLTGVLIAAAERQRPGLGAWSPQAREKLRQVFAAELAEVRARFFELFDDPSYWSKLEQTLLGVCFDRYCALAVTQTELEQRNYGLWRGGDLVARGAFAALGLAIGLFMVKAPFIPIPTTWDVFAFLTMLGGPFVPDFQIWLYQRRHRKNLLAIVRDMRDADAQRALYEPIPGLEARNGVPAIDAEGEKSAVPLAPNGSRTRH